MRISFKKSHEEQCARTQKKEQWWKHTNGNKFCANYSTQGHTNTKNRANEEEEGEEREGGEGGKVLELCVWGEDSQAAQGSRDVP